MVAVPLGATISRAGTAYARHAPVRATAARRRRGRARLLLVNKIQQMSGYKGARSRAQQLPLSQIESHKGLYTASDVTFLLSTLYSLGGPLWPRRGIWTLPRKRLRGYNSVVIKISLYLKMAHKNCQRFSVSHRIKIRLNYNL